MISRDYRLLSMFWSAMLHLLPMRAHRSFLRKEVDNSSNLKKKKSPCEGSFKAPHCKTAWWLNSLLQHSFSADVKKKKKKAIYFPPTHIPYFHHSQKFLNSFQTQYNVLSMLLVLQGTKRIINVFLGFLTKRSLSDPDNIQYCIQLCVRHFKRNTEQLKRTMKMNRGLENAIIKMMLV